MYFSYLVILIFIKMYIWTHRYIQLLLYKMTRQPPTCLTQPVATLFAFQTKKSCQLCTINKHFSDYIYSIATLWCKAFLKSVKTGQFTKLFEIIWNNAKSYKIICFFLYMQQRHFWNTVEHYGEAFFPQKFSS